MKIQYYIIVGLFLFMFQCKENSIDKNHSNKIPTINIIQGELVNVIKKDSVNKYIPKDHNEEIGNISRNIDPFIPPDYVVLDTVSGDLNLDNYNDLILVLKKANEEKTSDVIDNPEKRPLLILIGEPNNKYKLVERNDNTPTGLWATKYEKDANKGDLSYGNSGLIYLTGETDKALESKNQTTAREGIAIHCGHTRGWKKNNEEDAINDNGYLMMTYGCIRVYNADMAKLGEKYTALKSSGKTIKAYVENVRDITLVHDIYNAIRDPDEPGIKTRGTQTTQ
jgi:hypothetical protein